MLCLMECSLFHFPFLMASQGSIRTSQGHSNLEDIQKIVWGIRHFGSQVMSD